MLVTEYHKKKPVKHSATESEEKLKKLRKEYDKLVKGTFEFLDAQGGWLEFNYRFFPGDPIYKFRLVHGEITELPMGLVRHLNNTFKKIRMLSPTELKTDRGIPQQYTKVSRVRFTPIEVM